MICEMIFAGKLFLFFLPALLHVVNENYTKIFSDRVKTSRTDILCFIILQLMLLIIRCADKLQMTFIYLYVDLLGSFIKKMKK